ncbi:hypothetical protein Tco_1467827 [Tanacetum coccineum]
MFWHYARDDFMFTTVRVISKHQDTQVYGAILPQHLTNQVMLESEAYMTYRAYATGEKTPKLKSTKKKADSESFPKTKPTQASKGKRIKTSAKGDKAAKIKQSVTKSKGLTVLSEVALSEADQMKLATKRSKKEFYSSHASGSGNRVDIQSKVPDEQQHTISGTNEGASDKLKVLDVPEYRSKSEEQSWTFSQGEDDEENDEHDSEDDNDEHDSKNNNDDEDDDQENHSGETESDNDEDNFVHPNLSTYKADDQEKEKEEEKANDDNEVSSNQMVSTPPDYEISDEEEIQEDDDNKEEVHVTLTTEPPVVQQQSSSVSSDLVSKFINPSLDTGYPHQRLNYLSSNKPINLLKLYHLFRALLITTLRLKSNKLKEDSQAENDEFLKQIDSNIKAIIKDQVKAQVSKIMPKVEKYVIESLGAEVLARSSNQSQTSYAAVASLLEFELKKILIDKIEENKSMNRSDIQKNLYNTLIESYNSDKELFASYGDMRRRSGKEESSKEATQKESKSTSSSKGTSRSQPKSSGKSAQAEEHGQRVDDLEEPLHQEFNTGNDGVSLVRDIIAVDERLWNPSGSQTPDREWNKTKTIDNRPPQSWMTQLAQVSGTQSSFNEFLATPINFSAFIMNRLKLNNLTQDVLTGPTYDLMKVTCKSVVELEYHLEEVFKATNDQLNWHNLEGRPYPHDLSKPLLLIQNARGRQTKAADYGHVKWIEDKVPRSIWRLVYVIYDMHAYWGTYHWGPKRQRFYGYATNMETSKDVYSRHKIIVVTSLKIMEFFGYKHLEEITVRRQDDQLYRFQEGDFKRLSRQDIEDMLLLLVQGKLTNLKLDERFTLNVALRLYTRRIVIQERVEDLQLQLKATRRR